MRPMKSHRRSDSLTQISLLAQQQDSTNFTSMLVYDATKNDVMTTSRFWFREDVRVRPASAR